ncbi:MAG TPA: putative Ig domain-containing protein [Bryobacteraceae bacterium]|nr:putative Ig domain-containing protein [Bryobacteraceae bacterium]
MILTMMMRCFLFLVPAFAFILCPSAQPKDVERHHVANLDSSPQQYNLRLEGTVDAANTRDPIVYAAWNQVFDPMRSVKVENTGDTDVINPWITVNGKRDWRTTKAIAEEALRTYGDPATMSDGEKARAIWEFLRRNRFHATTGDFEVRDPVKMLNVYGFSLCGDNAPALMDLWRSAGLKTRRGFPIGHCVAEAWYDGAWHMLDADESIIFLDRDNRTIASERAVARDHDLSKRAYEDEYLPTLYNYDGTRSGDYPAHTAHSMNFTLRPGESLEWRWGQGSKHHYAPNPVLFLLKSSNLNEWGPKAWATLRNGKWAYTPPLTKPAGRKGAEARNIRWLEGAGGLAAIPQAAGELAALTWEMQTPYVMVGGRLRARTRLQADDLVVFSFSQDGSTWREIVRNQSQVDASLDAFFPSPGVAHYRYFIRAEFRAASDPEAVGLESITIENDLQMAPLAMPSLELGDNRILYRDETGGPRAVRATFEWVERSSLKPPDAPATPVFPKDGAEVEGTAVVFEWTKPPSSEERPVADYHFELSDEPEMRWALSPAFDVLISKTKGKGGTRFALPTAGLLNPGQTYYWRVRAKSEEGVWGAWSKTWSFVPQGPGIPLLPRLEERDPDAWTLAWDASPHGRKPARFRVYASDEKGFTVSDRPYEVAVGNQKERGLYPGKKQVTFPANFVAETGEPFLRIDPARAYYRVVAVDERGNVSGSSDFVEAPRPWIFSQPRMEATIGEPYRYEVKTIRSIGDLSYRDFGPGQSYQAAYWDAEKPEFSIETEMPRCGNFDAKWLKIDPDTGVLSGTPAAADTGEYQINVRVRVNGKEHVQSFPLKVNR